MDTTIYGVEFLGQGREMSCTVDVEALISTSTFPLSNAREWMYDVRYTALLITGPVRNTSGLGLSRSFGLYFVRARDL